MVNLFRCFTLKANEIIKQLSGESGKSQDILLIYYSFNRQPPNKEVTAIHISKIISFVNPGSQIAD